VHFTSPDTTGSRLSKASSRAACIASVYAADSCLSGRTNGLSGPVRLVGRTAQPLLYTVAIDKEILAPSSYRKSVVVPMPGPSDALNKPKASTSNVYAQKVVVKQAGRVSFPVSHNALTLHSQHSCRYTTCPPEQHYQARKFVLRIRSGCMSQDLHGLSCPWSWAARFNTWLLIKLTPKGVVYSFLFSCPCFGATCRVTWPIPCKTCKSRGCCNQTPQGSLTLPHPMFHNAQISFNHWSVTHQGRCSCHSSRTQSHSYSSCHNRRTNQTNGTGSINGPVPVNHKRLRSCPNSPQSVSWRKMVLPMVNSLLQDHSQHRLLRAWDLTQSLRLRVQVKHLIHRHVLGQQQPLRPQGPQMSSRHLQLSGAKTYLGRQAFVSFTSTGCM